MKTRDIHRGRIAANEDCSISRSSQENNNQRIVSDKVALITDGRFSGATRGASIGHVSPEAAEGGLIGLLEDGDEIHIDVDQYILQANLSDEVIAKRRKNFKPLVKPLTSKWLKQYRALVTNASSGAILYAE